MSMSTDSDISVELTGDDYDQLAETADDLANQISALPDAINVESSQASRPRVLPLRSTARMRLASV